MTSPLVRGAVAVAIAAVIGGASSAEAYRPPTRFLLGKAMEKQIGRETKTMKVEAETQSFDISGVPRGAPVPEKWLVMGPSTMRRDVEAPEGNRTEIRVDDKLIVRSGSSGDKNSKAVPDPFFDSIAASAPYDDDRASERLLKDAKSYGVNTEVVSLARFDGRVAWLIGSKPWEEDKPQLWLDKDTFLVVRVVRFSASSGPSGSVNKKIDERYLGWGSPIGGNWFPSSIEVWVDNKLVQRTLVRNVERNQAFDATLFK